MSQENGTTAFRTMSFLQKGHGKKGTRHTSTFSVLLCYQLSCPPETTQLLCSTLPQGSHVPRKEFRRQDKESFRMNCLRQ